MKRRYSETDDENNNQFSTLKGMNGKISDSVQTIRKLNDSEGHRIWRKSMLLHFRKLKLAPFIEGPKMNNPDDPNPRNGNESSRG